MPNIAVIYYSSTGTSFTMAQAVAEGADQAGAETRVRIVQELAPPEAIDRNPAWRAFVDAHRDDPRATLDDLEWADGVVFGAPTRFGNVPAQLKQFIDSTSPLWSQGKLADKVYAGFSSAVNTHGGQEATLLALYTTIHHWGGIIATTGYTDQVTYASGGNPYGPSVTASGEPGSYPTPEDLHHARYLGRRVTEVARKLRG